MAFKFPCLHDTQVKAWQTEMQMKSQMAIVAIFLMNTVITWLLSISQMRNMSESGQQNVITLDIKKEGKPAKKREGIGQR
mmetsp:Transcript_5069/g.9436  ORF Transcript_5069/g.9436 Transcript_5069/m.9436 type:complete len:80 (+) Transcript_5069:68-307(+)